MKKDITYLLVKVVDNLTICPLCKSALRNVKVEDSLYTCKITCIKENHFTLAVNYIPAASSLKYGEWVDNADMRFMLMSNIINEAQKLSGDKLADRIKNNISRITRASLLK